ncbi:MAG: peptide chain release factor 1 [Myxococcota bacterium]|nr:peptide chain release factor 1 [Myxococcota bacterium]
MIERLKDVAVRLNELNELLMDPAVSSDRNRMRDLSKEHAELAPIVEGYQRHTELSEQLVGALEMMEDPELKDMALEEKSSLEAALAEMEEELKLLLLPKDPYEGRNILLEIRAGTGGDEAALFAGDLYRMYNRYAQSKGWKLEVLSYSEISAGGNASGYKEIICQIRSDGVYSHLKYESGVHRVQRVPVTETQGRIHTSAATVAILPEPDEVEVNIRDQDLRIDVFRASGPGGQSVNTTDSAVRITHEPSGLVVICQDEKSQHKNKAKALKVLGARLFEMQERERQQAEAAERRSQVGSGDRSERIRTYNYPQNRVTDHRINLTLYKLDKVMEGELDDLVTGLTADEQARLIEEAEGN